MDDDETPITVEYIVTDPGCPCNGWDEPGWAPEIEITGAYTAGGKTVILTEVELDNFYSEIVENHRDEPYDGDC